MTSKGSVFLCMLLAACVYVAAAPNANADTIDWSGSVDGNNTENLSGQLGLEVTESGGVVSFKFENNVGIASSIKEVYFEDALSDWLDMSTMEISSQSGATFTEGGASPSSPPGLGSSFTVGAAGLAAADSGNGGPTSGIDTNTDSLTITFDMLSSASFTDLVAALNGATSWDDVLVAVHVTSIGAEGGSDTYGTGIVTPEPSSIVLLGFAMVGLVFVQRRRKVLA